jgi:hypothetical protein
MSFSVGDLGFNYGDYSVNPGGFTYPTGDFSGGFSMGDLGVNYGDYSVNNPFAKAQSGGGFFNQAGQFVDSLGRLIPGVTNIAKAYQDIAGVGAQQSPGIFNKQLTQESLDKINTERENTTKQIAATFERITGLTGKNIPDAVKKYEEAFKEYMPGAEQKGLTQIATPPEIATEYGRLKNRVDESNTQYSTLLNPRYQAAYKAPDAIASINTQAIKDVMSFSPANRELYNYSDPQSQRNIYGRPEANANLAQFYAGNQAVNDLMSYG